MLRFAAPACVIAFALALLGCGSGGSGSTTGETTTAAGRDSTAPTTTAPAAEVGLSRKAAQAKRKLEKLKREATGSAPSVPAGEDKGVPANGSEATGTRQDAAEGALVAYLKARDAGEWSAACGDLARSTRAGLAEIAKGLKGTGKGCAGLLKGAAARMPAASLAVPSKGSFSLRVQGGRPLAFWVGSDGQRYTIPMTLESGQWRVVQMVPALNPMGSQP